MQVLHSPGYLWVFQGRQSVFANHGSCAVGFTDHSFEPLNVFEGFLAVLWYAGESRYQFVHGISHGERLVLKECIPPGAQVAGKRDATTQSDVRSLCRASDLFAVAEFARNAKACTRAKTRARLVK